MVLKCRVSDLFRCSKSVKHASNYSNRQAKSKPAQKEEAVSNVRFNRKAHKESAKFTKLKY